MDHHQALYQSEQRALAENLRKLGMKRINRINERHSITQVV